MTFSIFLTMDLCQTLFEKSTNTVPRSSHMLRSVVVQSLSRVFLFVAPSTEAPQPGSRVLPCLLEAVPTLVHRVGDAIQPAHPLSSPFSSRLQSFPASGSFQMSQLFASGGQRIGASASASVLPRNIQGLFPLGLTGLLSLQSKGLSRVFSSTTV